jgi:hypothetical protein
MRNKRVNFSTNTVLYLRVKGKKHLRIAFENDGADSRKVGWHFCPKSLVGPHGSVWFLGWELSFQVFKEGY